MLTDQKLPDNQHILPTVDELLTAMADAELADSNTDNGCTVALETEDTVTTSTYGPHSEIIAQADI